MRVVRQVHPGEWPQELRVGQTLNLLTGQTNGPDAHLEISHLSASNVTWRVIASVQLASIPSTGERLSWEVPSVTSGNYTGKLRSMNANAELAFYLPDLMVYGRLQLVPTKEPGFVLMRQINLEGNRNLPRPPRLERSPRWAEGAVSIAIGIEPELSLIHI